MKLYLHTILTLIAFIAISYGQKKEIDFRTTDAKGLTPSELRLLEQSRDKFFAQMKKQAGYRSEIKSLVIQGNKIKTIIYNTGSISNPLVGGNVLDLVWNGLGYGYEFGPLVAAKVPKENSTVSYTHLT